MSDLMETRFALMDATDRLIADHPGFPAGSVIRCFTRQVALAVRAGALHSQVAAIAETRTRATLARRSGWVEGAVAAG